MEILLFAPPVVFIIFLVIFLAGSRGLKRYSNQGMSGEHQLDAYACGQRDVQNYVNPDYSQFFPIAFFFTIMHVLVLVVATAPADAVVLPVVFVFVGLLSIVMLLKR